MMLTFLFIIIPALSLNVKLLESLDIDCFLVRTNQFLHISPFILYLYLNHLYSIRGGSTIRADPLIKKPSFECFLKNPLYR